MKSTRKNIALEVNSALAIMQEIYNDIAEQKNNASMIMKKMLVFLKTSEDMLTIGQVIKEQQKILNDCTEKKISLVKIHSNLLKIDKTTSNKPSSSGKLELSDDDNKLLEEFLKNGKLEDNDEPNYTM